MPVFDVQVGISDETRRGIRGHERSTGGLLTLLLPYEVLPAFIPQGERDQERKSAPLINFRVHAKLATQLPDAARDNSQTEAESVCGVCLRLR